MGLFFRKENIEDKTIAEKNRDKEKAVPIETEVTNVLVEEPDAKYLKETSKAVQILLGQERDFYHTLPVETELRLLKEYLINPNEADFKEAIDREKELELQVRFNKPRAFDIPENMINILKNNLAIETEILLKENDKKTNELCKIRQQIEELLNKELELMNAISEQRDYIKLSKVMDDFLQNPTDAKEWGMSETNEYGQVYKHPSWLMFSLQSNGYPRIFTDTHKMYYQSSEERRSNL